MILMGDEVRRTQHGNNNAYCQDTEISWVDWQAIDEDLLEFTRQLIRLRRVHPTFWRQHWLTGQSPAGEGGGPDVAWFTSSGAPMTEHEWADHGLKSVGVFLNGGVFSGAGVRGERLSDDSFLLLFNAHDRAVEFTVTESVPDARWRVLVDTRKARGRASRRRFLAGDYVRVEARSLIILANSVSTTTSGDSVAT
jgi:isoamylase